MTLKQRVLDYLAKDGPSTTAQIANEISMHVSPSEAMRVYEISKKYDNKRWPSPKKYSISHMVESGRRKVIMVAVKYLFYSGVLVRVGKATYDVIEGGDA